MESDNERTGKEQASEPSRSDGSPQAGISGGESSLKRTLHEDDVVRALVGEGGGLPTKTVLLSGFLGKGAVEGRWRLYVDETLMEYVEIADKDIVHSVQHDDQIGSGKPTQLWVRPEAELEHQQIHSETIQAEFLGGEFVETVNRAQARFIGGGGGATALSPYTPTIVRATINTCTNTFFGACSSFGGLCRTVWEGCLPGPTFPSSDAPSGCLSLNACP